MTTKAAVDHLQKELKKDKEYREVWKANIAMAYIDSNESYKKTTGKKSLNQNDRHIIANNAAEFFLNQLCGQLKFPKGR